MRSSAGWMLLLVAAGLLGIGCQTSPSRYPGVQSNRLRSGQRAAVAFRAGNARQGRRLIEHFHCGACHLIPGVPHARGMVGPPLIDFGRRSYVAGVLPNTPANLERWLRSPPKVDPLTAMPTLGLSRQQARDVAAYLYTLR